MGAYLSEPRTEKTSEDDQSEALAVGASSMQGWRVSQEDAHNAILEYDVASSLFAVYDGHGGHEVAEYTAKKLPEFIKSQNAYKEGNIEKALVASFVGFDETIIHRDVVAELKILAGTMKEDDEEHDPNEVDHLFKEATMPIEEVISQYGDCVRKPLKNPVLAKVGESSSGGSGGKKPISPFLKAKKTSLANSGDGEAVNSHIRFTDEENMEEDAKKEVVAAQVQKEEVPEKSSDDADEKVKTEAGETKKEAVNGKAKENGSSADSEVKSGDSEEKKNLVNGHINGENDDHSPKEDGVAKSNGTASSKGKGKGKGKGKSNAIIAKKSSSEEEEMEELPQEVPDKKSPVKKSAQQLYHMLKDDEEVYDEESEDDDESFEHAEESSDDDDDDDEDEEQEDEEEEESDSDEEEEEEQGEEFIGGEFNEEPGNDSGCTAVVALLRGRDLFVANAGDSRCVVCRDGKAVDMSFDHKPEDAPEMERIKKAGGKVTPDGRVNGGLNLSRAIGDHAYKTNKSLPLTEQMISPVPDVKHLTINPDSDRFMILACDGIWNSMSSQEVVDFVNQRLDKNPEKISSICEELFDHCLSPDTLGDGTGCDNMTAVIVKFKGGELKSAEVSSSAAVKRSAEEAAETPSKKACTE